MRINHLFKHWYLGSEAFEKDCFWSDLSRRENWDSLNKTKRWDDFSERERRFYINYSSFSSVCFYRHMWE
ncbi:hypothetical protein A2619_04460 [candidate division WWE3 bacterium RIFOXYD1_FULL_39_9]|uniref:Uncharacterized protein n=1 Tax=candidate division WWE3 bacterium RIFOXYD1_FULL_39_9 TaxID=1802649 RepID=A0A1F4X6J1_UNCKA|nr:MAG: hypothetical protein A2619_04460 [candidate division WWE3 bacterium RIFOXYD1_FULL_39_9]